MKALEPVILIAIAGVYFGNSQLVKLPQSSELLEVEGVIFPAGYTLVTLVFSLLLFVTKVLGYDYTE